MALSTEEIRQYTKDMPELNVLLEGELQSGEPALELAIKLAVDDFNAEQPLSHYTVANFPSDTVLMYGVLHHLCVGEAERQLRNQVSYNAQGLNAGLDDKFEQYNRLAMFYRQMFESKAGKLKQALNIASAWGGMSSPYARLDGYYS